MSLFLKLVLIFKTKNDDEDDKKMLDHDMPIDEYLNQNTCFYIPHGFTPHTQVFLSTLNDCVTNLKNSQTNLKLSIKIACPGFLICDHYCQILLVDDKNITDLFDDISNMGKSFWGVIQVHTSIVF